MLYCVIGGIILFIGNICFAYFTHFCGKVREYSVKDFLVGLSLFVWIISFLTGPAFFMQSGMDTGYKVGYARGQMDAVSGIVKYEKYDIPATQEWREKK